MLRFAFLGIAIVAGLLASTSVQAQILGISGQFSGSGTPLSTADTAGVVALSNYNVLSGGSGSATNLLNSKGDATTLSLSYAGAYTNAGYSGPYTTADQRLTSGGISVNSHSASDTVSLTNIPFSSYSLYVYVSPNNGNGGNTFFDNTVTDGTTSYYSYFPGGGFGGYNRATSTTSATYTANANYILFTGETAPSLTFSLTPLNNGGSDINGFQIIDTSAAVPEPSSAWASALGGGVLAFGLWKRRLHN